jgi:hypothetical protein
MAAERTDLPLNVEGRAAENDLEAMAAARCDCRGGTAPAA